MTDTIAAARHLAPAAHHSAASSLMRDTMWLIAVSFPSKILVLRSFHIAHTARMAIVLSPFILVEDESSVRLANHLATPWTGVQFVGLSFGS